MRRVVPSVVLLFALLTAVGSAQHDAAADAPLLQRVFARADEPLTRYRAMRRLEARNEKHKLHAWLDVWTELGPDGFRYQVLREGGNEWMRNRILRSLLDKEEELFASRNASRAAITPANYDLTFAAAVSPGIVKLTARPKRRDVALVDGSIYVSEAEGDIVRVEGKLAKTPSFWMKQVDVVRHFRRIGGVRVPVRLESLAHVRIGGASTMTMTYDYVMVNGSTVVPTSATAQNVLPRPGSQNQ